MYEAVCSILIDTDTCARRCGCVLYIFFDMRVYVCVLYITIYIFISLWYYIWHDGDKVCLYFYIYIANMIIWRHTTGWGGGVMET